MSRTTQQQLVEKGLGKEPDKKKDLKRNEKKSTKLSKKEIEELMGINRPRYYRSKGSFRSR